MKATLAVLLVGCGGVLLATSHGVEITVSIGALITIVGLCIAVKTDIEEL